MLQITGQVVNFFTVQGGVGKDGNEYEARDKVQLMGQVVLANGDTKFDLMDLKVDDSELWESFKGKNIAVEVGAFAPSKGNIIFTVRKGAKPRLVAPAVA